MISRRAIAICAVSVLALAALPAIAGPVESSQPPRASFDGGLTFQPVVTVVDSDRLTRSGRVRDVSYWTKTADGMKRIGGATILYNDVDRDGEPDSDEVISISPNPS